MNPEFGNTPARQAAMNGLAVIGFIALIAAGVWLAVYSTRFVPTVVNRIGAAAVYLGSVLAPAPGPSLTVTPSPTASTTIPFDVATTTSGVATTTAPAVSKKRSGPYPTTGGAPALYGLPDLVVVMTAQGYLAADNELNSFVASATVPAGRQPAVQFSVENKGTNVSGPWQLTTDPQLASAAETQPSLAPGSRAGYVIYVDRTNRSTQDLTIVVSENLQESNTNNNSVSLTFTLD